MGTFGNWPENMHVDADQQKRIASAKKKEKNHYNQQPVR